MNYESCSLQLNNQTGDYYVQNADNCTVPLTNWWGDNWHGCYHWYYPQVTVYEDKMSKAFRIVKSLMDKKIVEAKTIKQFIDLVDTISKEL